MRRDGRTSTIHRRRSSEEGSIAVAPGFRNRSLHPRWSPVNVRHWASRPKHHGRSRSSSERRSDGLAGPTPGNAGGTRGRPGVGLGQSRSPGRLGRARKPGIGRRRPSPHASTSSRGLSSRASLPEATPRREEVISILNGSNPVAIKARGPPRAFEGPVELPQGYAPRPDQQEMQSSFPNRIDLLISRIQNSEMGTSCHRFAKRYVIS